MSVCVWCVSGYVSMVWYVSVSVCGVSVAWCVSVCMVCPYSVSMYYVSVCLCVYYVFVWYVCVICVCDMVCVCDCVSMV